MTAIIGVLFAVSVTVLTLTAGVAYAHFLGYDSVDDCEIRWEDDTGYDTERIAAIDIWDDIKGDDDCVDIVPDTLNTVADLEWKDTYAPDVEWPGLYEPQNLTDHNIEHLLYEPIQQLFT